jgi:hypothetical protein
VRTRTAAARARLALLAIETEVQRLTLRARRGELVEAPVIDRTLFDFGRRHRDALLTWPARVGAALAAELGVDQGALVGQLEEAVGQLLDALADACGDLEDLDAELTVAARLG